METFGQDLYLRSLQQMLPVRYYRSLAWVPAGQEHLRSDLLPHSSPPDYFESTSVLLLVFLGALACTLLPIIPFTIWAFLEWTSLGNRLLAVLPFTLHPLVVAYAITFILLLILRAVWPIEAKYRRSRFEKSREALRTEMTCDQTLFYWANRLLENITSFAINRSEDQLSAALKVARELEIAFIQIDPRRYVPNSELTRLPGGVLSTLDLLHSAVSTITQALLQSEVQIDLARRAVELMCLVLYANLPDLSKLVSGPELDQLRDQAREALTCLETTIASIEELLPPTQEPQVTPDRQDTSDEPQTERSTWLSAFLRLMGNAVAGLVVSSVFVLPAYLFVAANIRPESRDALRIATLPVFFTITLGVATALFGRGPKGGKV